MLVFVACFFLVSDFLIFVIIAQLFLVVDFVFDIIFGRGFRFKYVLAPEQSVGKNSIFLMNFSVHSI